MLRAPEPVDALPAAGFAQGERMYVAPPPPAAAARLGPIAISPHSARLQLLVPFDDFKASNYEDMRVLVKVKGKCTTDHISAAGAWLKYKGKQRSFPSLPPRPPMALVIMSKQRQPQQAILKTLRRTR